MILFCQFVAGGDILPDETPLGKGYKAARSLPEPVGRGVSDKVIWCFDRRAVMLFTRSPPTHSRHSQELLHHHPPLQQTLQGKQYGFCLTGVSGQLSPVSPEQDLPRQLTAQGFTILTLHSGKQAADSQRVNVYKLSHQPLFSHKQRRGKNTSF